MARLAWFSPMPPVATGVATCSADLVPHARPHPSRLTSSWTSQWRGSPLACGRRTTSSGATGSSPYDLTVYPGGKFVAPRLSVALPLQVSRPDRAPRRASASCAGRGALAQRSRRRLSPGVRVRTTPTTTPDLAELAIAGFDSHLYYDWPMTRLVAERSRLVAVHSAPLAESLATDVPAARVRAIRLGHGTRLSNEESAAASNRARARYQIPQRRHRLRAVMAGCPLTSGCRKFWRRWPRRASYIPAAHLLLAGGVPEHYDLAGDVERLGLNERRHRDRIPADRTRRSPTALPPATSR